MATYSGQTPIKGTSRGDPAKIKRWLRQQGVGRPEDADDYVDGLYEMAPDFGINADVAVAQFIKEASRREPPHEPGHGVPWLHGLNPVGIGVTSDAQWRVYQFVTGRNAAMAHLMQLSIYVNGLDLPPGYRIEAPYEDAPNPPPRWYETIKAKPSRIKSARVLSDLDNRWAVPGVGYGAHIGQILNRFEAAGLLTGTPDTTPPDPQPDPQEGNDMPTYKTVIPGVPGGPLPTSFPLHLKIVPAWRTNNRPGIKARTPRLSVQHETANSGTYAAAEANYLYNGAGGRQASWHFTVDDREGYVTIPVDEVAWQAGDGSGPGNYNGVACELAVHRDIVNNPTRRAQSQKNAAELMGKVGARLNATPPARQHANFMNKNCPAQMRNRGEWNRYVDWWHHFYQMEKAAMEGKTPEQEYIYIGDTLRVLVDLNLRQRATTQAPVITTLPAGTEIVVNGRFESADGYGWLPVQTPEGEGFVAMGSEGVMWIEKIKDRPAPQPEPEPEPEPEPQYVPARPIPALLETDLKKYDTAEGITTDDLGQDFVFVADVVEFVVITVAGEFAVDNPRATKAPYQIGDRAIAAWLVKSKSTNKWHYILAGGDDEWVRVPYANTKRVSDAPLLPGQEWGESEEADVSDVINALQDTLDSN